MVKIAGLTVLCAACLLAFTPAAPARAQAAALPTQKVQTARPPAPPPATAAVRAAPTPYQPSADVLGVHVVADAPVSPSYDGTAYKTLGGQAETGEDAIAGQVMQPQDGGPR